MIFGMATGDELISEVRKQTKLAEKSYNKLRSIAASLVILIILVILALVFGLKIIVL